MAWKRRTGIMLCQPLDDNLLQWNFKNPTHNFLLVQPKLDGIRCHVTWSDGGQPILWSSEGNLITSVPHINKELETLYHSYTDSEENKKSLLRFDGELYNHTLSFEEIVSRVKRTTNLHKRYEDIQFHVFDTIVENAPQNLRTDFLSSLFNRFVVGRPQLTHLIQVPHHFDASLEEIARHLDLFIEEGYEGIVVRNLSAFYTVDKRPRTILKWKPSKSDWYRIVEVKEAISEDGHPLGRLGSLVCEDSFGQTFSVGTGIGIDQEYMHFLWEHRDGLPGMYAHVYYQNLTSKGVPRFGKVVSISERSGEDENT